MLILDFLRSVSKILSLGAIPSFAVSRKKRKKTEDDDEEDADIEQNISKDNPTEETEFVIPEDRAATRGTVLITLRNVSPYTLWSAQSSLSWVCGCSIISRDVPRLAKKPPIPTSGSTPQNPSYILLRSFQFDRGVYANYEHRMTKGTRAHGIGKTGEGGEDRTWEFCLQDHLD